MDATFIYNLILIVLLLLSSAFFCFAEGSLFALGRHQKQRLFKENTGSSKIIKRLLSDPFKLIVTILFADEVVNVAFSSIIGLTVKGLMTGSSEKTITFVSIAVASPTLLLIGEIGPKTVAVKFPRVIAKAVAYPLHFFHILITPIRWVIMLVSIGFTKILGGRVGYEDHSGFSADELKILLGIGNEEGVLNEVENNLVSSFYKLENLPVHKIMTPKVDCFMLSSKESVRKTVYEIKKRGYSRTPVYEDDEIDNIIGILFSKDLLTSNALSIDSGSGSIEQYLKTPYFIPRTKMAFDLMREFQKTHNHMAIVVDEYGRVDGIVTLEDILEELFGDIQDETQHDAKPKVTISGRSLTFPGAMKIDEFNENYLFMVIRYGGLSKLYENLTSSVLPSEEEHETLGGFIFDLFGRFPTEGQNINHGSLRFTVLKIHKKRIAEIQVEMIEPEEIPHAA